MDSGKWKIPLEHGIPISKCFFHFEMRFPFIRIHLFDLFSILPDFHISIYKGAHQHLKYITARPCQQDHYQHHRKPWPGSLHRLLSLTPVLSLVRWEAAGAHQPRLGLLPVRP